MPLFPEQDEAQLSSALASILLVAGGPVPFASISRTLGVPVSRVSCVVHHLSGLLPAGIAIQVFSRQVQLVTAPENADIVQQFLGAEKLPPVSRAAMETLTVVAYRQPVTRAEIEALRGVNSDRVVRTLLARGLVEERGRRDSVGRPTEYGTTFAFLEYFGLRSLDELPDLPSDEPPRADAGLFGMRDGSAKESTEPSKSLA